MLDINKSVFVIIDEQEKLVRTALNGDLLVSNTIKVGKAAEILSIPTIITEQYPKGLGATVEDLKIASQSAHIIEKASFSAYQEPEFVNCLKGLNRKQVLLCGIEGHICVLQTAIDLIKHGYEVYILKDCTSSREKQNLVTAFELLQQYGVKLTCVEIALFQWLKTSKHPSFKEVQKLII